MVGVQLGIKYGIFIAISEIIQLNPVIDEHTYIIKREEKFCHYCQAHLKTTLSLSTLVLIGKNTSDFSVTRGELKQERRTFQRRILKTF